MEETAPKREDLALEWKNLLQRIKWQITHSLGQLQIMLENMPFEYARKYFAAPYHY
jgi:hypothetical protein